MALTWQRTSTAPESQPRRFPRLAWPPVPAVDCPRALSHPQGLSTRFSLAALVRGSRLDSRSWHRHLPAPLGSAGITRFLGYYGCSDSYTAALRPRLAGNEHRLVTRAGLPLSSCRTFRPFCLQPPLAVPMRCLTFSSSGLPSVVSPRRRPRLHRGPSVIWASPLTSRLATATGRIEFAAAGLRQPVLRTGRSPPVAPHPASRRRSCFRLHVR